MQRRLENWGKLQPGVPAVAHVTTRDPCVPPAFEAGLCGLWAVGILTTISLRAAREPPTRARTEELSLMRVGREAAAQ
jgi:hypothetical protein